MKTFKQTLIAGTLGLACSTQALASLLPDGSFENGLTGWTPAGDATTTGAAYGSGPTHLLRQALLTTALDANDDLSGDNFNASANAPAQVGSAGGLEEQLGLAIGDLDGFFGDLPTEGSGLYRTFTAGAGYRIVFRWNFLTNDDASADFAFVAVDGVMALLTDALSATLLTSNTPFGWETGFQMFKSSPLTASGTHTLAIGVVDLNDFTLSSGLLVDEVSLVPLPATAWLLGVGLLPLVGTLVRRKTGPTSA
jgi:hypothetical protein